MRTTMNLPDALLEEIRSRASAERRTVTSVMEQALREFLNRRGSDLTPVRLPTNGDPGVRFLIDIDDKEAVQAVLDSDVYR